ncbi:EipB family protein [Reyranella sp.]|uniref:EipB family protein n=1 Tax=Reyranella sp. TaxID=1929291 RepID=UPI003BAA6D66
MLTARLLIPALALSAIPLAAAAQELVPHRAAYTVTALEQGKPGVGTIGTYAYELQLTCDGSYLVHQRLRLEVDGPRAAVATEQQSQMTESRNGRKLSFEHRTSSGRQSSVVKGEAVIGDDGKGEARFAEPEGQSVALPAGTLFPLAIARETIRRADAGDSGFDARFFFGEKVKPPQTVNVVIGRVPRRLADLKIPEGGEELADGRRRIYYRAGFFDAEAKGQGEPAFEMSSVTLDNGIELYGTHEESDGGIEYRITRLEPLAKPECK